MSTFNPETFMQTSFTDALETRIPTIPEGEYVSRIDKVEVVEWNSERTGKSGLKANVTWVTDDPAVSAVTGLTESRITQGIMLDLTESGGLAIGAGKNITLGRLREAVDQNTPGQPWSFPMLVGRVARIRVVHRLYEGETYADVRGTAHI